MKIRFVKACVVEVQKARLNETWDKGFNRWDELYVESLHYPNPKIANVITREGDILVEVPINAFEVVAV